MSDIKSNLSSIEQQISKACEAVNRSKSEVTLLAVSKTKPVELIEQAYQQGQKHFGENYLQEAVEKITQLSALKDISWHFIGPIQSNKTNDIAKHFLWVHSVDRIKIAKRLNDHRSSQDTPLNVCLQVNISEESTKSGVLEKDINELALYISECPYLVFRGIMAIPEKNAPKSTYQKMHQLFSELQTRYSTVDTLSMGMSNDLTQAIASGSTMVRIGTALFGARN